MGQPRIGDEDCQPFSPQTVTSNDSHLDSQNYYLLHAMGLGNLIRAPSLNCNYPPPISVLPQHSQNRQQQQQQQQQCNSSSSDLRSGGGGGDQQYSWGCSPSPPLQHSLQPPSSRHQQYHQGGGGGTLYSYHQEQNDSHRSSGAPVKKNNAWMYKNNSSRCERSSRQAQDDSRLGTESDSNSTLSERQLSYECLSDPGIDDTNKHAKRYHNHETYAVPPYPLPTPSFTQHQQFGNNYMGSSYQHHHHHHHQQPHYGQYYQGNNSAHLKRRHGQQNRGVVSSLSIRQPSTIAPDRFLARSHLSFVKDKPKQLYMGNEWDKLSEDAWNLFIANQQTEDMFKKKMNLWKTIYHTIRTLMPKYGVYLVGSTLSGLGTKTSDVDVCLTVRPSDLDPRSEAFFHLAIVHDLLRGYMEDPELIQAKVPILKFKDTKYGLEVDLNCNNSVGIRNTHLLYCYANLDWRVRPLVLVVKLWAQRQGINDAKNMTISSYSLALMVINFLQCGTSPPVLPSLQLMYPEKFNNQNPVHYIEIHEELPPYDTENKQSLGELLLGFLDYYGNSFDFGQVAASVRLASTISIDECRRAKALKNDPHQWKYLCIEEPFELTNTARSVYDRTAFERVRTVFMTSWVNLKTKRTLQSIFEPPRCKTSSLLL